MTNVHTKARNFIPLGCSSSLSEAFETLDGAKNFYHEWTQEVRKTVPSNKLIELNVKNGTECWNQLCGALGIKKIPQEPFPHANDGVSFRRKIWKNTIFRVIQKVTYLLVMFSVVLAIK